MRCAPLLALVLVLGAAPRAGAATSPEPAYNSASILFHLHPRPWRPPLAGIAAGLRMAVDPVSGTLVDEVPGPAALAAARAARAAARASTRVEARPDGSTIALLGGAIRAWSVARIDADGRLVEDCVRSEDAARRLMASPPPAAAKAER